MLGLLSVSHPSRTHTFWSACENTRVWTQCLAVGVQIAVARPPRVLVKYTSSPQQVICVHLLTFLPMSNRVCDMITFTSMCLWDVLERSPGRRAPLQRVLTHFSSTAWCAGTHCKLHDSDCERDSAHAPLCVRFNSTPWYPRCFLHQRLG